jgi:Family of unknown function (DUF6134)
MIRPPLLAALLAGAMAAASGQSLPAQPPSSQPLAQDIWAFRVLLDGREVGSHRFTLASVDAQQRELRSVARFDVTVLRVPVYRYRHEAVESWEGGCLRQLVSHSETNGQREQVRAQALGDRLVVEAGGTRREHAGCVMSFAYWDPRILRAERLLNSQTGELMPVTITARGEETLTVQGESRLAQRHRISGPGLRIDLWYAGDQWVALEAEAEGGRRLRYERT